MPLKLRNGSGGSDYILDVLKFSKDANLSNYFIVSTSDNKIEIPFEYIPPLQEWDHTKYDLFLFENPYLNAENDVFELYIKELTSDRIGWIFPIAILESDENNFRDTAAKTNVLNGYRYVAYHKLLCKDMIFEIKQGQPDYKITDIYHESTIICLISKDSVGQEFKIDDYLLSFHVYGYSLLKEMPKSIKFESCTIVDDIRGQITLNLRKSNFHFHSDNYIKSLFEEYLITNNNSLLRFVFLYQVIEYLIKIEYDRLFEEYIDKYQKGSISSNDFRENLNTLGSEKKRIVSVLDNASITNDLKVIFERDCQSLFNDMSYSCDDRFPNILYTLRNKITHEYRNLLPYKEQLDNLIYLFEKIIIEILLTYNSKHDNILSKNNESLKDIETIKVLTPPIIDEIFEVDIPKLQQPIVITKIDVTGNERFPHKKA